MPEYMIVIGIILLVALAIVVIHYLTGGYKFDAGRALVVKAHPEKYVEQRVNNRIDTVKSKQDEHIDELYKLVHKLACECYRHEKIFGIPSGNCTICKQNEDRKV